MSELPKSWTKSSVGDLADSIQYGHTAKSSNDPVGPKFLRITDIQDNNVDWSSVPFCPIPEEQIPKYLLEKGDLLFARTGATVGKSFLIHSEIPESVFASYLIRVRVTEAVVPRYIYYFFQSADYWRQISESASGIGQPNVNGKKLAALELPIAPLPEQRRIVARIEELFSRLDAGVAALRHAKAQLQRYRQSVLAAAVTGQLTQAWREQHPDTEPASDLLERILEERREQWDGTKKDKPVSIPNVDNLPELPAGWTWAPVQNLSEPKQDAIFAGPFGTIFKAKDFRDEGVPIIFLRHVGPDRYRTHKPGFMDREKWNELFQPYSVWGGELLITKLGEPPGVCCEYPTDIGPAMVTPDVMKLSVNESAASKRYLISYFNSEIARRFTFGVAFGTTRLRLTLLIFRSMPVPLPPLAEQNQIVAEVEARSTAIDHLEAELDRQIIRSNRLRQSTLASAFEGSL